MMAIFSIVLANGYLQHLAQPVGDGREHVVGALKEEAFPARYVQVLSLSNKVKTAPTPLPCMLHSPPADLDVPGVVVYADKLSARLYASDSSGATA